MSADIAKQNELLEDILKWIRFSALKQAKETILATLDSEQKKLAYQLSDGKTTSTSIAQSTGISQPHISELWREWASLGLGDTISASGGSRFKRSFDLKSLGIPFPQTPRSREPMRDQTTTQTQDEVITNQ